MIGEESIDCAQSIPVLDIHLLRLVVGLIIVVAQEISEKIVLLCAESQ